MFRVEGALKFFKSRNIKVMLMGKDITDISHLDYQRHVKLFTQKLVDERKKKEISADIKIEDVARLIDDVIVNYGQPGTFGLMAIKDYFPSGEIVEAILRSGKTLLPEDKRELLKVLKEAYILYEKGAKVSEEILPADVKTASLIQKPEKPAFLALFEKVVPVGKDGAGNTLFRKLNPIAHPVQRPDKRIVILISSDPNCQRSFNNDIKFDPFVAESDIDLRYLMEGGNSTRAFIDAQRRSYELQLRLWGLQAGNDHQAISQVKKEIAICEQIIQEAVGEVQKLERPAAVVIDLDQAVHQDSLKIIIEHCDLLGIPVVLIKTQLVQKIDPDHKRFSFPKVTFNMGALNTII
jgi:hypothetical protein